MTPRSSPALLVLLLLTALMLPGPGASSKLQIQHSAVTRMRAIKSNYHWTISNYSLYHLKKSSFLDSPTITTHDEGIRLNWSITLYHNGSNPLDQNVSVYLNYKSGDLDSLPVSYTFHLLKADESDYKRSEGTVEFSRGQGYGVQRLVSTSEIVEPANDLLVDDEIQLFVEFVAFIGDRSYTNDCRRSDGAEPESSPHLEPFLGSYEYSDLTLSVENAEFRAHRLILASRSRVFDEVFKNYGTGRSILKFTMEDFSAEIVAEALMYMYSGKIGQLTHDQAAELLSLTYKYDIAGLKDLVREQLCLALDLDPEERARTMDALEYDAIEAARRSPIDAQKACSIVPLDLSRLYAIE